MSGTLESHVPGFDRGALEEAFRGNFESRGELGAAVSVWIDGREAAHLCGGWTSREQDTPWSPETIAPVWSATKGPAALTVLLVLHDSGLDLGTPVQEVWPELRAPITFAGLLSHRAGLAALDAPPSVFDYHSVVRALEAQEPFQPPGCTQAYHPRTIGYLYDEVVRRLSGGRSLGECWFERIARPWDIDFHIGLPPSEFSRVARVYPGPATPPAEEDRDFHEAMASADSLTRRAFASPRGLHAVSEMNEPRAWQAALPAFGGVGSARGLAKFYNMLACGGRIEGAQAVPDAVVRLASGRLTDGMDGVLRIPAAFSAGFMMDPVAGGVPVRGLFGSAGGFGHPGAGGSHAFVDPERRLSFAYVMNRMGAGVLPNAKARSLVRALYPSGV